jgi:hypothetical protein
MSCTTLTILPFISDDSNAELHVPIPTKDDVKGEKIYIVKSGKIVFEIVEQGPSVCFQCICKTKKQ